MNRKFAVATGAIALLFSLAVAALPFFKAKPFEGELEAEKPYASITATLALGAAVPEFTLADQQQNKHSLSDYRGQQVLLVFYRGAWCPFCVSHLDDIQNLFPTLQSYGVQLLAISPDPAKKSAKLAKRFNQPYLFLSDPELQTAAAYGVQRDEKLPHPAVFLIDKEGKLAWYHIDQNYKRRASGLQLKAVLEELAGEKPGQPDSE